MALTLPVDRARSSQRGRRSAERLSRSALATPAGEAVAGVDALGHDDLLLTGGLSGVRCELAAAEAAPRRVREPEPPENVRPCIDQLPPVSHAAMPSQFTPVFGPYLLGVRRGGGCGLRGRQRAATRCCSATATAWVTQHRLRPGAVDAHRSPSCDELDAREVGQLGRRALACADSRRRRQAPARWSDGSRRPPAVARDPDGERSRPTPPPADRLWRRCRCGERLAVALGW